MGFGGPSDGEMRMALAELIRQDETLDIELRRSLRVVTGWRNATYVSYPGTSSEHERASIEVFYETWDGIECTYTYDGAFGYLLGTLEGMVNNYGT
jgi:hypothetical protein